jgi:hypothetical protein
LYSRSDLRKNIVIDPMVVTTVTTTPTIISVGTSIAAAPEKKGKEATL